MISLLTMLLLMGSMHPGTDDYDVVLLRPSRYLAEKPRMGGEVHRYMQNTRELLNLAGLKHHTIDESDALSEGIKSDEFLICPYNPDMQPDVVAAIEEYLDGGGHALICYVCPDGLRKRLGIGNLLYTSGGNEDLFRYLESTGFEPESMPDRIRYDSWNAFLLASIDEDIARPVLEWIAADESTNSGPAVVMTDEAAWMGHIITPGNLPVKARMLLSIIGRWKPDVWDAAARHVLDDHLGFRYASDLKALVELADGKQTEASVQACVEKIRGLRDASDSEPAWRIFNQGLQLRSEMARLYGASLPSGPDKMRGAWVVNPRGVGEWGWEKTARIAAENGLTDLFVRVEWGGRASYQSDVIRTRIEKGEDPVAEGIAACHKYGLHYHAWFINLNWRMPPKSIVEECSAENMWQVSPDGEERIAEGGDRVYWLNPSEPAVVKLQADMMSEVAENYDVDGVHFDYIRYEGYNGSYGARDRDRFEKWANVKAEHWPEDVLRGRGDEADGPLHEKFCEWRCEQVSNVVKRVAEAVRDADEDCTISAAVYPSWPYHRKSVGQDWVRWLREGWIDFVCPMTYGGPGLFDRHVDRVQRQRAAAADGPLMVGVGAWLHPTATTVAETVVADRTLGADGFVMFSYTERFGEEILPVLSSGVFSE